METIMVAISLFCQNVETLNNGFWVKTPLKCTRTLVNCVVMDVQSTNNTPALSYDKCLKGESWKQ